MTAVWQIRATGASLTLKDGGLSILKATPVVVAFAKAHKAEILAELKHEQASPTVYVMARGLGAMRDHLDRIYADHGDKSKCMALDDLIVSILVEEDDPSEFLRVLRNSKVALLDLVRDVEANRALEGKELERTARRIFTEKAAVAPTDKRVNAGAFA